MKMEQIVSSETSAIRTQTPGNYPKRNNLHLEHGESLRTITNSFKSCIATVYTKNVNEAVRLLLLLAKAESTHYETGTELLQE